MLRLLSVLLISAFLATPAFAQDVGSCTSWPDVPINVKAEFDPPNYDYSQNIAAIQALSNDSNHTIPQYHTVTLGLTQYKPVLDFTIPISVEDQGDGLTCAYVQHVDVTVGFKDVTVFIASEIPQDSCGFIETKEHEEKHIAVNQQVLNEFVPIIQQRFKEYLKYNGVLRLPNAGYARQVINDRLKSIMEDIDTQMEAENVARQRAVDSQAEYLRLTNVCGGQLFRTAEDYRWLGK